MIKHLWRYVEIEKEIFIRTFYGLLLILVWNIVLNSCIDVVKIFMYKTHERKIKLVWENFTFITTFLILPFIISRVFVFSASSQSFRCCWEFNNKIYYIYNKATEHHKARHIYKKKTSYIEHYKWEKGSRKCVLRTFCVRDNIPNKCSGKLKKYYNELCKHGQNIFLYFLFIHKLCDVWVWRQKKKPFSLNLFVSR